MRIHPFVLKKEVWTSGHNARQREMITCTPGWWLKLFNDRRGGGATGVSRIRVDSCAKNYFRNATVKIMGLCSVFFPLNCTTVRVSFQRIQIQMNLWKWNKKEMKKKKKPSLTLFLQRNKFQVFLFTSLGLSNFY